MNTLADTQYNGQVLQDKFVLTMLGHKRHGTFLELGANDPCFISNTYLLESKYDWKGIMVEYDTKFKQPYVVKRPNSHHVFQDATTVDYASLLSSLSYPTEIDYLQVDLEPGNGSTLFTLQHLDATVFDKYKFAIVTFEHDIYQSADIFHKTRTESRRIFEKRGYVRVFSDVTCDAWTEVDMLRKQLLAGTAVSSRKVFANNHPFEDWYVHPSLVDMTYVNSLIKINKSNYIPHPVCGSTISFTAFEY